MLNKMKEQFTRENMHLMQILRWLLAIELHSVRPTEKILNTIQGQKIFFFFGKQFWFTEVLIEKF